MFDDFANRRRELQATDRTIRQLAGDLVKRMAVSFQRHRGRRARRGQFAGLNRDQAVFNFVWIFEKPALRRAGGARAVAVVCAAVAWAHEEPGLRKPANRTSEVRAVHGEDLELIASDPRTQHAVSTVLPSVGITYGFRKVASRVSPSGNSLTEPSDTHDR